MSRFAQAEELQKRATKLRSRLDLSLTSTWRSFEDLVACLVACDALQPDSLKALPLGHVARQIHGENELWLAMVLTHPAVQVSHAVIAFLTCKPLTAQGGCPAIVPCNLLCGLTCSEGFMSCGL